MHVILVFNDRVGMAMRNAGAAQPSPMPLR